jgi:hypothetical protein
LESFRSKAELVQAAIDVVESKYFWIISLTLQTLNRIGNEAHQKIYLEKEVLHRDVSLNNIMLYTPNTPASRDTTASNVRDTLNPDRAENYVVADTRRGLLNDYDYAYANKLGKRDGLGRRTVRFKSCWMYFIFNSNSN